VLRRCLAIAHKVIANFSKFTTFSRRIGFGMTGKSLPPVQLSKFDPVFKSVAPSNP